MHKNREKIVEEVKPISPWIYRRKPPGQPLRHARLRLPPSLHAVDLIVFCRKYREITIDRIALLEKECRQNLATRSILKNDHAITICATVLRLTPFFLWWFFKHYYTRVWSYVYSLLEARNLTWVVGKECIELSKPCGK